MVSVAGNRFRIEFQRLHDPDGEVAVCPKEELGIIEVVKIVDRVHRAEGNVLDLLQIDEIDLLLIRGRSAEPQPIKGILQGISESAAEHRRSRRIVYLVIAGFCRIVHDFSAVYQKHEFVLSHMDHRSVGDHVFCPFAVCIAPIIFTNGNTFTKNGVIAHIVGFNNFQPLIGKTSAYSSSKCSNDSHNKNSLSIEVISSIA